MPRPKNIAAHQEISQDIKAVAREQLAQKGTNGISLRGIARELGITAPAIYNYFPRLDDLITALIVDAFNGHADAIDAAVAKHDEPTKQLKAALQAYRDWAVQYPSDFQLIYGNPIPGYEAPAEITIPLASRPMETIYRCILAGYEANAMNIPERYLTVPQSIVDFLNEWLFEQRPILKEIPYAIEIFGSCA